MLDESARGVYVISVTPFDDRGALDLDGTDRLIDFYAGTGVDGITILGVMGEAPKLAHEEAIAFARRVIARAGKLPVVVGVSSPGLASLAALTKAVRFVGRCAALGGSPPTARSSPRSGRSEYKRATILQPMLPANGR